MTTTEQMKAVKEKIEEMIAELKQIQQTKNELEELGIHTVSIDVGFRELSPDYASEWMNDEKIDIDKIEMATISIPYIHLGNGIEEVSNFFKCRCRQKNNGNYEKFSIIDGIKFLQLPDKKVSTLVFKPIKEVNKNE